MSRAIEGRCHGDVFCLVEGREGDFASCRASLRTSRGHASRLVRASCDFLIRTCFVRWGTTGGAWQSDLLATLCLRSPLRIRRHRFVPGHPRDRLAR